MIALNVRPSQLVAGDILAADQSVWVAAVYVDAEGTWVDWSDGSDGYMESKVKIIRPDWWSA